MGKTINKVQAIQDEEYQFPYHYISEFRDNFSQTFNWTWGLYHASTTEFLLKKLRQFQFLSIADIGCGDGRFTRELFVEFPEKKVLGIDYSKKAIDIAKAMNSTVQFTCVNILEDQIADSFDIICLVEVIEHIPQTLVPDFIKAVHRLLNAQGKVIITVPHINKPLEEKHFQHFTLQLLEEYTNGFFEIKEVIYFEKTGVYSKIINKILTNPLFILNQKNLKNLLYGIYKRWLFQAKEKNCSRMYIELMKL